MRNRITNLGKKTTSAYKSSIQEKQHNIFSHVENEAVKREKTKVATEPPMYLNSAILQKSYSLKEDFKHSRGLMQSEKGNEIKNANFGAATNYKEKRNARACSKTGPITDGCSCNAVL